MVYNVTWPRSAHRCAAILLLIVLFSPAVAAQDYAFIADCDYTGDLQGTMECTFLPEDTQIEGYQHLIFGILLPFLFVFSALGLTLGNIFGRTRETGVMSLVMSLFLIPSGGYRFVSEFFLAIGGLGADGFTMPGTAWTVDLTDPLIAPFIAAFFGILIPGMYFYHYNLKYRGKPSFSIIEIGFMAVVTIGFWVMIAGLDAAEAFFYGELVYGSLLDELVYGLLIVFLIWLLYKLGGVVGFSISIILISVGIAVGVGVEEILGFPVFDILFADGFVALGTLLIVVAVCGLFSRRFK